MKEILIRLAETNPSLLNYWVGKGREVFKKAVEVMEVRWQIALSAYRLHTSMVFSGGISQYHKWYPIDEAEKLYKYAPLLARSVAPHEIVLDIDVKNEEVAFQTLNSLLDILTTYDITPLICYTGNRGYHCDFFVKGISNPIMFKKGFVMAMYTIWDVDKSVVKERALIREIYSINPKTGYLKVPSTEYKKCTFKDCHAEEIDYREWVFVVPKELEELCYQLAEVKIRKEYMYEHKTISSNDKVVEKALELMKPYLAKEYDNFIAYHCPFHPPDKHPSFAIYKPTDEYPFWLAIDFHTGEKMSLGGLIKRLKELKGGV